MEKNYIEIEAFEIRQPICSFYVAKINHYDLINLASTDMHNITENNNFNIYQRKLDLKRIPALKKYMSYSNATFPNGIILNAKENAILDFKNNKLKVKNIKNAFFIIDGQHRIEALNYYSNNNIPFQLCVIIFNNVDIDTQTEIFATVNGEQKPVNPTVKLNLKGNDDVDTPDKVIRDIIILLNKEKDSPFYEMIKIDDISKGILSMAAIASPLLEFIYDKSDYYNIKDVLILEKNDRYKLKELFNYNLTKKIFWEMYVDSADNVMYKMLFNYFSVIKEYFSKTKYKSESGENIVVNQWNNKDYILCKTTGYNALIMLLKDIIVRKCNYDFTADNFKKILDNFSNIFDRLITQENFGSGLAASNRLYTYFYYIIFGDNKNEKFNEEQMEFLFNE